jgi:anti-sigma regulatory factor (Ser/Thr protein kinase)
MMAPGSFPTERWSIAAVPAAVGPARDLALAHALAWRYRLDETGQQMLKLLVSEMVTNALLYGLPDADPDPTIDIAMEARPGGILFTVRDHSSAPPDHLNPTADDVHGRGMSIMQELAASTGWFPTADGKAVYAIMAADRVPTRQQQRAALLLARIRAIAPRPRVYGLHSAVAA